MNNLKSIKTAEEFILDTENADYLNEYMNVIMLIENEENRRDEYKVKIIKSSSYQGEYVIKLKKNKLLFEF